MLAGRVGDWRGVPKVEPSLLLRSLWECIARGMTNRLVAKPPNHLALPQVHF
jgi:hypothetical protein